jgi:hypothetical protein
LLTRSTVNFPYHPESDTYTFPAGEALPHAGKEKCPAAIHHSYRASAAECAACPFKAQCCPQKAVSARKVVRVERAPVVRAFRAKMETEEAEQVY